NWKQSIVDLMKLLGLDSSLNARKELAQELGYTGALNGSAEMNIWLHQQVMTKLAESGGKGPGSLRHAEQRANLPPISQRYLASSTIPRATKGSRQLLANRSGTKPAKHHGAPLGCPVQYLPLFSSLRLDCLLDLLLDGLQVEARALLHRRELDRGLGEFVHLLLHQHQAPRPLGEPR